MSKHHSKQKKLRIICFAGCDWWYHNRGLFCTQVMKQLAKNHKVLFVNSLGMRIPSFRKDRNAAKKIVRKLRSMLRFLRKVDDKMYVLSPISLPLGSRVGRKLNAFSVFLQVKLVAVLLGFRDPVVYIGCLPALEVAKRLGRRQFLIYERTDVFEEMPGANKSYLVSLNDELIKTADLVLYVNKALWEEGVKKNKNSLLIGHGVDFDFFANAAKSKHIPEDITKIARPIVGFYGDFCERTSDMELLEYVVERLPNLSFVFIGSISADISRFSRFGNVYFFGRKSYKEIPNYGKEFDVAIMPWNNSKWIEFCNPIKIKEFLALGKPVVSTYYPEIEPYSDLVYIARDYDEFISCIHEAVEEHDPAKAEDRRKRVQDETWDSKVEQIKAAIEKGLHQEECPSSR